MWLDGIIVKREGTVNPDVSQIKDRNGAAFDFGTQVTRLFFIHLLLFYES